MKKLYFFALLSIFFKSTNAQTFSVSPSAFIPDNAITNYTMAVSGLPTQMNLANIGIEAAQINVTHTKDVDLTFTLISPGGKQIKLAQNNGGSGSNFTNTFFYDTIPVNINAGIAPFNGSYAPYEALSSYNNLANPNGIWTLRIRDQTVTNTGTLISWGIKFSNKPAGKVSFSSSNLPIVIVNTGSLTIVGGTKITAMMSIIDHGFGIPNYVTDIPNNYYGNIGIEIRGQSSTGFAQKQYGLETRDALGNNVNVSILGMPPENDWILYAPYNDKSLMRNTLAYKLARDMGRWASRGKFCELVVNGIYQGVYVYQEKIKIDVNRVNISKLLPADTVGVELTGGYIINIDKDPASWYSAVPPNNSTGGQKIRFTCNSPDTVAIMKKQRAYIKSFVDSFETALNGVNYMDPLIGYRKYASVNSFVDYFIINELSRNVDGYRLSTYLHKDKITKGGQLKIAPVWDYNLAFNNANYCNGSLTTGWAYLFNPVCSGDTWQVPFWWDKLVLDTCFKTKLYCKYSEARSTYLDTVNLFKAIDSVATLVNDAKSRQYKRYSILGTYVWPNPSPYAKTYEQENRNMKNWLKARLAWMDANILSNGICHWPAPPPPPPNGIYENDFKLLNVSAYPNPFKSSFFINMKVLKENKFNIDLYNINGQVVRSIKTDVLEPEEYNFYIDDVATLINGIYLLRISDLNGNSKTIKLIKN